MEEKKEELEHCLLRTEDGKCSIGVGECKIPLCMRGAEANEWATQQALKRLVQAEQTSSEGYKNDEKDSKLRWDLLPMELIEWAVKVYTFGAKKYKPNTWQNIGKMSDGTSEFDRYEAAFMRHLVAYKKGEFCDSESELPHLAHCLWNAIAMLHFGIKNEKEDVSHINVLDLCK